MGLTCSYKWSYNSDVRFEWDETKNLANIRKHGLDFADAWEVLRARYWPG